MKKNTQGNVLIITIMIIAVIVVLAFIGLKNLKNPTDSGSDYNTNTSTTPTPVGSPTDTKFDNTSDQDIQKMDSEFNKIDAQMFSNTELSNSTLGI